MGYKSSAFALLYDRPSIATPIAREVRKAQRIKANRLLRIKDWGGLLSLASVVKNYQAVTKYNFFLSSLMDYHDFLNKFHPISRKDYQLIADSLTTCHAKRNELIAIEGDITRDLYFVYEGLQISCYNHDGTERVMSFHYPQSLMGLPDSFYKQQPTQYYIRALTDSSYGAISFHRLEELFDESQAIERLFRKMTEAKFCGLITRHTEFHTCTIEERFKNFISRSPNLLNMVPHKYIASYLNIDATNFSKLYNSIRI